MGGPAKGFDLQPDKALVGQAELHVGRLGHNRPMIVNWSLIYLVAQWIIRLVMIPVVVRRRQSPAS